MDRYTKAYGAAPSTFAGHAYDALYLIVEAARQVSGELTPAALRDQIEKTKAFSGIGGSFTFSPTDHNGLTEQGPQHVRGQERRMDDRALTKAGSRDRGRSQPPPVTVTREW